MWTETSTNCELNKCFPVSFECQLFERKVTETVGMLKIYIVSKVQNGIQDD